jgi:hypothetical protein
MATHSGVIMRSAYACPVESYLLRSAYLLLTPLHHELQGNFPLGYTLPKHFFSTCSAALSSFWGRQPNLPQARIWAVLYRFALAVPPLLPISLAVIGLPLMRRSLAEEERNHL